MARCCTSNVLPAAKRNRINMRFRDYTIRLIVDNVLNNANVIMMAVLGLCIFAISCIKLHLPEPWIESDNADSINEVLVNLSYSYIAGFVFYVFTVALPQMLLKRRMRTAIAVKIRTISTKYKSCLSSVVPVLDRKTFDYSEDNFVKSFSGISYMNKCSLSDLNLVNATIIDYVIEQHQVCLTLIAQLLEYRDLLNSDTIALLEKMRESDYENVLLAFRKCIKPPLSLDKPSEREKLAKAIYKQYERSCKLSVD